MCVRPARLNQQKAIGLTVPCGQCVECRLKRSRDWAIRCVHEASLYDQNSFISLTYADDYLPKGGSLDRHAMPKFMKRLRKEVGPVRSFYAGEYGEKDGRPHYHALLFGLRFADERPDGKSGSGFPAFTSDTLSWLWPFGFNQIGEVTFESAQYVARYLMDTCSKEQRAAARETGFEPEFGRMSRGNGIPGDPGRYGIGARWLEQFGAEVERDDAVVVRGTVVSAPRYYDRQLDDARQEVMKARRLRKLCARASSNPFRWQERACREVIAVAKLRQLEEMRR